MQLSSEQLEVWVSSYECIDCLNIQGNLSLETKDNNRSVSFLLE